MAISGSWGATSTWVVESYPTVTRSVGYGWVNMTARIGGIIAPFALDLDYYFGVSYIICGILQVICLGLTLFVPETRGTSLADNMKAATDIESNVTKPNGHRAGALKEPPEVETTKPENGGHLNLSMCDAYKL
ncbi:solute carrier family 22 member 21 [Elysia marginata]|uniref:Solute carrier family 22 member 21 n=1 Tax=Elysia marginata TaxID=1093978 RepID=A0AAV4J072_9GAST|nr:solute carrier family 22 member 21 [Elysia marginata]